MKTEIGRRFVFAFFKGWYGWRRFIIFDYWYFRLFSKVRDVRGGKYSASRLHLNSIKAWETEHGWTPESIKVKDFIKPIINHGTPPVKIDTNNKGV